MREIMHDKDQDSEQINEVASLKNYKTPEIADLDTDEIVSREKEQLKEIRIALQEQKGNIAQEQLSAERIMEISKIFETREEHDLTPANYPDLIDDLIKILKSRIGLSEILPESLNLLNVSATSDGKIRMYKVCRNGKRYEINFNFDEEEIQRYKDEGAEQNISVAINIESSYN